MEFEIRFFHAWKVTESDFCSGKSWKVVENKQMVAAFLTCVLVSGLHIHYHCILSDLVQHGSTLLSSKKKKVKVKVEHLL